jgi:hypothetical protein
MGWEGRQHAASEVAGSSCGVRALKLQAEVALEVAATRSTKKTAPRSKEPDCLPPWPLASLRHFYFNYILVCSKML